MNHSKISNLEKCHLWFERLTKEMLFTSFETVKSYRDNYHNTRELKKCKVCGLLYFYEFIEIVDFGDGNDNEYYSFIPVNSIEDADRLNDLSELELTSYLGIHMNFPPYNSAPFWLNR